MAAHRKSDRRRVYLYAGGLRKRESSIAPALDIQSLCHCGVEPVGVLGDRAKPYTKIRPSRVDDYLR
jgi:hypothetical protein